MYDNISIGTGLAPAQFDKLSKLLGEIKHNQEVIMAKLDQQNADLLAAFQASKEATDAISANLVVVGTSLGNIAEDIKRLVAANSGSLPDTTIQAFQTHATNLNTMKDGIKVLADAALGIANSVEDPVENPVPPPPEPPVLP